MAFINNLVPKNTSNGTSTLDAENHFIRCNDIPVPCNTLALIKPLKLSSTTFIILTDTSIHQYNNITCKWSKLCDLSPDLANHYNCNGAAIDAKNRLLYLMTNFGLWRVNLVTKIATRISKLPQTYLSPTVFSKQGIHVVNEILISFDNPSNTNKPQKSQKNVPEETIKRPKNKSFETIFSLPWRTKININTKPKQTKRDKNKPKINSKQTNGSNIEINSKDTKALNTNIKDPNKVSSKVSIQYQNDNSITITHQKNMISRAEILPMPAYAHYNEATDSIITISSIIPMYGCQHALGNLSVYSCATKEVRSLGNDPKYGDFCTSSKYCVNEQGTSLIMLGGGKDEHSRDIESSDEIIIVSLVDGSIQKCTLHCPEPDQYHAIAMDYTDSQIQLLVSGWLRNLFFGPQYSDRTNNADHSTDITKTVGAIQNTNKRPTNNKTSEYKPIGLVFPQALYACIWTLIEIGYVHILSFTRGKHFRIDINSIMQHNSGKLHIPQTSQYVLKSCNRCHRTGKDCPHCKNLFGLYCVNCNAHYCFVCAETRNGFWMGPRAAQTFGSHWQCPVCH